MAQQNNLENTEQTLKAAADSLTVGGVIGHITGWFTLPNLITIFTLVWAFGRAVETVTGKPIHTHIKEYRDRRAQKSV